MIKSPLSPEEIKKIIDEKVIGKILPEHDVYGHHYRFVASQKLVDSVTTILATRDKDHLNRWKIRLAIEWLEQEGRFEKLKEVEFRKQYIETAMQASNDVRDDAGHVGTDAHEAIELYIKDWMKIYPSKPDDIKRYFKAGADPRSIASARSVEKLFREQNIIPLASEILVGDERYSAGTLDFLCLWDGVITLADFKTSNNVGDDYAEQTSAYKYFFEYMTGVKIEQIKILHLSKDMDKFHNYKVPRPNEAYKSFKGLCAAYRWKNNGRKKLEKDIKRLVLK